MSTTAKTVIAVVVVIVLIGLGYWYVHTYGVNGANTGSNGAAAAGIFNHTGSTANAQLPGGSSDSDAALNQDTAAIDAQMNGLSSDNANVTSATNDQSSI